MSYPTNSEYRKAKSRPARQSWPEKKTLVLSERDRKAFLDALIHPPEPNARLRRALKAANTRVLCR